MKRRARRALRHLAIGGLIVFVAGILAGPAAAARTHKRHSKAPAHTQTHASARSPARTASRTPVPAPAPAPVPAPTAPEFAETACTVPKITAEIRPRLRCGTVGVPRDYGNPGAGRFELAVVVIRSEREPAEPDPLVYISGGPGAPLTTYAWYQATHPMAPGRDLVLIDQRGMGRSEPGLCPGRIADFVRTLAVAAIEPATDTLAWRRAVFMDCRRQAMARQIDLQDFGTSVTAEDFDWVRQALGLPRWNVFGVSYGTTVAMTLMARHPETIRSAVLDSVYPPDPILPPSSANVAAARTEFFAACDKDPACAAVYPDLEGLYRETVEQLRRAPLSMNLPQGIHDPTGFARLTASLFTFVVGRLVYSPNFYPGLPRLVAAVHDGDTTIFAGIFASLAATAADPETGPSFAAYAAVECRDRPRFRQPLEDDAGIFDRTALYGVCEDWSPPGPPPVIPVDSKVPTLVLAGQFDPNARPDASRKVADLIGANAKWIEFPLAGHSVRAFSPCAAKIVAAFIDQPDRPPDAACAENPPPIPFLARQPAPRDPSSGGEP